MSRPLSSRVREELQDINSYNSKLPPDAQVWLKENYIDPELKQQFRPGTDQSEKRRVWRQAKRELACLDGVPGILRFDSRLIGDSSIKSDAECRIEVSKFLDDLFQK